MISFEYVIYWFLSKIISNFVCSFENLLTHIAIVSIKYVKKSNQITNHYYEYKIAMAVGAVFAS